VLNKTLSWPDDNVSEVAKPEVVIKSRHICFNAKMFLHKVALYETARLIS
jgi:hypothetical protein